MTDSNPDNVSSGFEILMEELEAEIDFFTSSGSRAFEIRDFPKVDEARMQAETITAFREKVAVLRKEWDAVSKSLAEVNEESKTERHTRNLGRLRRGLRTPEADYYIPILKALVDFGGKAKMKVVLDKVYKTMKPILKDVDYEPLASNPEMPRWRNSAQWARNTMRLEGLLKDDSPHGTWEITSAGRNWLRKNKH